MSIQDSFEIALKCPGCAHETKQTVGWLKDHDRFTCGGCGAVVALTGDRAAVAEGLGKLDDAWAKFRK